MQKGTKIVFAQNYANIYLKFDTKLQATVNSQRLFHVSFNVNYYFALVTAVLSQIKL